MSASITGGLVNLATHVINDLGLAGIFLMIAMSSIIFVPGTEAPMLFAGFDVAAHHHGFSLVSIIVAGVLGDVVGASLAYVIGRRGLHEVLNDMPGPFHVSDAELERAHRWFDRYGFGVMAVSRFLPVVRAAFPYAAGTARMPYHRFLPAAAVGSLVWIGGLALLGDAVGKQWPTWKHHLDYVDYVGAAVLVAAAVWVVVRWSRTRRTHA